MKETKKVAQNGIIQLIGKILSTGLGLVAIAMMTRYLGAEQFGWYTTAIYFLQFAAILTDFGTIPVTAQMLSEPAFEKKRLLNNIFTFRFFTALIFLGIAPLIVLFFPYAPEVKSAVAIVTISMFAVALNQVFTGFFQFQLKMHIQAIGEVVGRIVLIAGLWLLIAGNAGFLPVMWAITAAAIAYTVVMYIGATKIQPIRFAFDWNIWKAMMSKMWPIAISIMFNVMYLKGDAIILSLYHDATEVGIYGAAYRVIDILAQTAMLLMGILLPLLAYAYSRGEKALFRTRLQQSFDAMMMLCIPIIVGVIALAEPIILLIAGEDFIQSTVPLIILSLAVFGLYLGAIFGHVAVSIDKQKQTMWIYISGAILTIIGYFYTIPKFGMIGAAWMSVASELYVGLLLFFVVQKYLSQPLSMKTVLKIVLSSAIMVAVIVLLPAWHVLIVSLIAAITYAVCLLAAGALRKEFVLDLMKKS